MNLALYILSLLEVKFGIRGQNTMSFSMCTFRENQCREDHTYLTDMNVITFMHTLTFF
jgi:hypothetical protein